MSTQPEERTEPEAAENPPATGSFAIAAVVLGVAVYLTQGLLTMEVPSTADFPGPRFFPTVVAVLAYILVVALIVQGVRNRALPAQPTRTSPGTDWAAVAGIVATLIVFTLLLRPLGWILAGMLLFYGVAYFLGSRRLVFDLGLALGVSSIVQLVFSAGLGLNLPAGVLGMI
ncbi:tripartite tricarboxylate transporter TctB family protein [Kineosporia babensis]|uniref:Tripartite tricarboxylate transporter TctB family protein n=1 Tax=Kineosporia babensis TaxID=499548 RepID=A0A9X1NHQ9_9ACTN|nr:tripartite tricarboxylate transporter TctB family protein [Kineosporia babensis]